MNAAEKRTTVLIPIDNSDCSKRTLEWAAGLLDLRKTDFHLLHIIPTGIPELVMEVFQVEDALKYLNEAEMVLKENGATVASAKYVEGDPADSICMYAREEGIAQILMGSHGRSGLAKVFLGSVSSAVLERAEVPVFIYKNLCKEGVPQKA